MTEPAAAVKGGRGIFGAFGIRNFLLVFLLAVSFAGTFIGVSEYISANFGRLDIANRAVVAFVVLVITGLMAYAVYRTVSPGVAMASRALWLVVYLTIAAISVCFAFGFWWRVMEARNETNVSVAADTDRIALGLRNAQRQLRFAGENLDKLATDSENLAATESLRGGTCRDDSQSGRGPRARLRDDHAKLFRSASTDLQTRLAPIESGLGQSLRAIESSNRAAVSAGAAQRVRTLSENRRELSQLSESVNQLRTDPQLQAYAAEFARLAPLYGRRYGFEDAATGARFTCQDSRIQTALLAAYGSLSAIQPLPPPNFRIFEGSDATLEAFQRLGRTLFGWIVPRTESRNPEGGAAGASSGDARTGEGLGPRDIVPLAIAAVIDLGVLAISIDRDRTNDRHGPNGPLPIDRDVERELKEAVRRRRKDKRRRRDDSAALIEAQGRLLNPNAALLGAVLIEHYDRRYLVLPRKVDGDEDLRRRTAERRRFLAHFRNPSMSAVEQIYTRRGRKWDERAREALIAQSPEKAAWADARGFEWFELKADGAETICTILDRLDEMRRHDPNSGFRARLFSYKARQKDALEKLADQQELAETEIVEARRDVQKQHNDEYVALHRRQMELAAARQREELKLEVAVDEARAELRKEVGNERLALIWREIAETKRRIEDILRPRAEAPRGGVGDGAEETDTRKDSRRRAWSRSNGRSRAKPGGRGA